MVPSLIFAKDNFNLLHVPSDEDVKGTVFQLDLSSALGPDGFNGFFYRAC